MMHFSEAVAEISVNKLEIEAAARGLTEEAALVLSAKCLELGAAKATFTGSVY